MDGGRLDRMGNGNPYFDNLTGGNAMITYNCKVWDSVSQEWQPAVVTVPPPPRHDPEGYAEHAQRINEAVSWLFEEEPGAWYLRDQHMIDASGQQVIMVHLQNTKGDHSVILATEEVEYESESPRDMGWVNKKNGLP